MNKYKIGVVTFFDAYNYGALFQTYALQRFLNNNDVSSCILNYKWHPKEKINSIRGILYWVSHKKFVKKKKDSFEQFLSACNFTNFYTNETIENAKNECERFVVGSDQVWNSKWNFNSNVFYLTFTDKKFSYAASFGSIKAISNYRNKLIKDDLSLFNAISVREKSAQSYLNSLGIKSRTNIDPVFLLSKEEWLSHCSNTKFKNYALIYSLENNSEMIDFAKKYAREKNLKLFLISDTRKKKLFGIETIRYASPNEFLTLFGKSSAVITNSFHGTAFSIIFNKQFYAFLQKANNAPNDRLVDLLNDCGLSSRIVSSSFKDEECNFEVANDFIEKERKISLEYLSNIATGKLDKEHASNNTEFKTEYFYAKCKKIEDLLHSRSGGIAYCLGSQYIENGGVVYGAVLDECFDVNITRITDLNILKKTRNSKYVSSNICNSFQLVKEDLLKNKKVLFCALPCQINGLLTYLKTNSVDTSLLLTIDIVCHGAPKGMYFKKYIEFLEKKYNGNIRCFNFRDKRFGWDTHFESFMIKNKLYKSRKYTQFFYSNYGLKEGCYVCPFSNFNRVSDLTLCDAWGYIEDNDKQNGANLVLINTRKGQESFKEISHLIDSKKINRLEFIQPNLMKPTEKPVDYSEIIKKIDNASFKDIYRISTKKVRKIEKNNKRKRHFLCLLHLFKK